MTQQRDEINISNEVYHKAHSMGAHGSLHKKSHAKSSSTEIGTGDRRTMVNSNTENRNVFPVGESTQSSRMNGNSSLTFQQSSLSSRTTNDIIYGSGSHEDITDIIGSRGRVAYMKAVKQARDKGKKHYKITHDAIVNSMMKVENILAGTSMTPMIFGKHILLSAAKADSAQASSSNKAMRRSLSEHVVTTSGSPPNNRIRDQMMKEKLINEQMRTKGSVSSLRTQSFILPRVLHVIPEQPEEDVMDPETYSYSDINVYF